MIKYLVILLLLMSVVSAADYDGWHNSGDTFDVDGDEYYVYHEQNDDKALISVNEKTSLVKVGKCFEVENKEVCLEEIDEDLNSDRVTYKDGVFTTAVKISVNKIGPDVSISKSASKKTLKIEETSTVSVTISNKGNRPVDRYNYVDIFPEELRVLEASAGTNQYEHSGNLGPGDSRTLSFTVEAMPGFDSFVSRGNLTYTYNDVTKSLLTSSLSFSVDYPYDVDIELDYEQIKLDEDITYEVEVANPSEEDLEVVSLELFHPGFRSSSFDNGNLTAGVGKLIWKGFLDKDEDFDFKVKFQPEDFGKKNITLKILFEYDRKRYTFLDQKTIDVISDEPEPDVTKTVTDSDEEEKEVEKTEQKDEKEEVEKQAEPEKEPLFKEKGPGVFTRMVRSFAGFFKWLFS